MLWPISTLIRLFYWHVSRVRKERAVREGKVLFSTIAKPGMLGVGMAPKENFLVYSMQFIFLIIRLLPGNVVMVAIGMYGKSPITGK